MKYSVSSEKNKPAYIQLYAQVRDDIVCGAYAFGARLPSKRILAEETGISVITVKHAYELLCDEGYVESKQRSGYFVIYRQSDFTGANIGASAEKISATHTSASFAFPFSVVAKTMRKVLSDCGDAIFFPSPNKGIIELRKALCGYLERSVGISADAERIVVGAGAEYLYGLIVQLLGKDAVYALENPSYEKIREVYEAHGVKCEMLEMGENGITTDALKRSEAAVLHVTPFNSFPSLVSADASKRYEYIRIMRERGGIIVEDNYESELTVSKKNDESIYSLCGGDGTIYLNTFSRTVSPSVRMGYMVLPYSLAAKFDEKLGFYSCTVSVFDQLVMAELINGGEFERHINRVRREKRKLLK